MSALDLEPIKARAAAATPGPWYQGQDGIRYESAREAWTRRDMNDPESADLYPTTTHAEDAAFIAHSRTDIDALVAEVERLRERATAHAVLSAIEALRPEMGMHINVSEYRRGKDDALVLARAAVIALFPAVQPTGVADAG